MQKNLWERISEWFTISRVLITFWNGIAFCYHFLYIGIGSQTSIVIQITAILTEYLLSGPYERVLLWSNFIINANTQKITSPKKIIIKMMSKYIIFATIFATIYGTTYYMRLIFFYVINWGIDSNQLNRSMINMVWFILIAGPLMGMIVLARKKKRREMRERKQYLNRLKCNSPN